MEKWDLDDYMEEVKFQMTEFDEMTEEIILDWEKRARDWVWKNQGRKRFTVKAKDDILIEVKNEDEMYEVALKYQNAVRKNQIEQYWYSFSL